MNDRELLIKISTHLAGSIYQGGTKWDAQTVAKKAFSTSVYLLDQINKMTNGA